jgi:FixJ family two-component response regulator
MKRGARKTTRTSSTDESVVFVVDDDQVMLGALSSLFRSVGLSVVTFESAADLLQYRLPDIPSCLVLDIRLPRLSGLDLQAELRASGVMIPIIFITGHGDIPMSVRAMKAGAIDFLTKPFRDWEILDAVTDALKRDRERRKEEKSNSDIHTRLASLTPRQRQVMSLVTSGLLNKQIAAEIGLAEMTVKIHRAHVMRKMGARSLADLVMIAERLGVRGRN